MLLLLQLMGGSTAARGLGSSMRGPAAEEAQGEDVGQELFNGRILTQEEQRVWDALPETAKRLSMDGIMSLEAHMVSVQRAISSGGALLPWGQDSSPGRTGMPCFCCRRKLCGCEYGWDKAPSAPNT